MNKTIYHYNSRTGDYLGAGEADKDPLDHDNWLIPANATDIAPPAAVAGKRRVFNGARWALVDIPVPDIGAVRAVVRSAIKAERDRRTEQGGYKVGGLWFHSDAKSRSQQQDNEAMGDSLAPVQWKTLSGDFVTMTPDLAAQIRTARMTNDRAIFDAAEAHRAAMEASANPADYDFSSGWPPAYNTEN